MKNKIFCRVLFYAIGLLVLALGLTLNTKTGLGVSPIISVAYSISEIFDHNFGNMTLALYSVFVVIEMVLHLIRERRYSRAEGGVLANAGRKDLRLILLMDFLQIPLSIVFTRFLNVFSAVIPGLYSDGPASPGELAARVVFLIIAIILTGIGAAMSLDMRIVPNPGDGIVQAIADTVRKSVGFTKNCFDLTNITITVVLSFVFAGHLVGVGVGTILAMIGVGRTIAVFNHFTYAKMGNENNLYFSFGGAQAVARVSKYEISQIGDRVSFVFMPSKMHFFDKETGVNYTEL